MITSVRCRVKIIDRPNRSLAVSQGNRVVVLPKVTWITNFVPPYAAPMYHQLAEKLPGFRLLLSTKMERDRTWNPVPCAPYARLQRTITVTVRSRHPNG